MKAILPLIMLFFIAGARPTLSAQDTIRSSTKEVIVVENQSPIDVTGIEAPVKVELSESALQQIMALMKQIAAPPSAAVREPPVSSPSFVARYGRALEGRFVQLSEGRLTVVADASQATHQVQEVGRDYLRLGSLSKPGLSFFVSPLAYPILWSQASPEGASPGATPGALKRD